MFGDHLGPGFYQSKWIQPVPNPTPPQNNARIHRYTGMNATQKRMWLRFPARKSNPNNIDHGAKGGVLQEIARIGASIGSQDANPIISLAFIATNKEITDPCQLVSNPNGMLVQALLRGYRLPAGINVSLNRERKNKNTHPPAPP